MQTFLPDELLATDRGREADRILRSCVHCGFCTATCPTYLLSGNELDGPRGRIYLIKEMLEGAEPGRATQLHLDRCLTCQSCETTCPSDVQYHSLLNIGRAELEARVGRPWPARVRRWLLRKVVGNRRLFNAALGLGRLTHPLLPARLKKTVPSRTPAGDWPALESGRQVLLLNGCAQGGLSPNTNAAAARVLASLGVQALTAGEEKCCGALAYHMNAQAEGLAKARRNIDLFCARLDDGLEAIISSASGCGNFLKDYGELLAGDPAYAGKARRVAARVLDLSEFLLEEDLENLRLAHSRKLAFQCPCSLQHGQQLGGRVEEILTRLDFDLTPVRDPHLCCGSAGAYSLLQPEFAEALKRRKLESLEAGRPDAIASANIGCQVHLASGTEKPVRHWIEYIDEALEGSGPRRQLAVLNP